MVAQANARDTAPTQSATAVTPGTIYAASRGLRIDCTVTGVLSYTLADGSGIVLHLTGGDIYEFNDSVISVPTWTGTGAIYLLY